MEFKAINWKLLGIILLLSNFLVKANNAEPFKKNLLEKKKINSLHFGSSVDFLTFEKKVLTDTLNVYYDWLFTNKELLLSDENPYFKVHVLLELAGAKYAGDEYDEAFKYIDSTFVFFQKLLFPDVYLKINRYGAAIAYSKSNLKKAGYYFEKMLDTEKVMSDSVLLADIYLNLSNCYLNDQQYDKSIHYSYLAYPIFNALNKTPELIEILLNMYNCSFFTSNDSTNTDYLYRAIDMAQNYGDSILISTTYDELGKSYYRRGNYPEAIRYYKIARNYASDKGSKREVRIAVLQHLSYKYMPDSVEAACEISDYILTQSLKNKDVKLLSNAYLSRANCFANHGLRDSAIYYLERSEENRVAYGNAGAAQGYYYVMYEVALKIKDYERAMRYLTISTEQNLKASREANTGELTATRAKLDYQLQKEQISELKFINDLQQEKNKRQQLSILAITLLLLTGAAFFIYARKKYNQLRESYRELIKKNVELDHLSTRLIQTEEKLQNSNGNGIKDEEKIYQKLKELFEKEKIYKQPDISLSKLARKLKTNTSYLSLIINNRFEEPFKTLINKCRINEARRLLSSPEYSKYSIEGIAEEVGYQSRSTFYQSFKQITGLTPTQYIENLRDISVVEQ